MKNSNFLQINEKEKGQSLLELAVSLVVLLILLAGVVDLGRIAFYYIAMRDAAQEGASYGSIFPNNNFEIIERTKAGMVDQSAIDKISVKFTNISGNYECEWIKTDDPKNACVTSIDTCSTNPVLVEDTIEVTIIDSDFQITMPLLGTFLGKQSIALETSIKDKIIRVPECE